NSGRTRGFQLWLALGPEQELGQSESIYQRAQDVHAAGPDAGLLGTVAEWWSPLKAPSSINYLAVRLKAGEAWRYEPPADHTISWIALRSRRVTDPQPAEAGELVAVETSHQAIDFRAEADTEFVLGSAARHPYELSLGYYSVHT